MTFLAFQRDLPNLGLRFRNSANDRDCPSDRDALRLRDILLLLDNNRYRFDFGEHLRFLLNACLDNCPSEIVGDSTRFRLRTRILRAGNRNISKLGLGCRVCAFDRERFRNRNSDCFGYRVWFWNPEWNPFRDNVSLFDNARLDSRMCKDFGSCFRRTGFRPTSHPLCHRFALGNGAFDRYPNRNWPDNGLNDCSGNWDFLDARTSNGLNKSFSNGFGTAILPQKTLSI
jgi:hypothetical protein